MDEDEWLIVNGIDCAEEALFLSSPSRSPSDSEPESDGSFSIINDYPTDSCSEEEHEQPLTEEYIKNPKVESSDSQTNQESINGNQNFDRIEISDKNKSALELVPEEELTEFQSTCDNSNPPKLATVPNRFTQDGQLQTLAIGLFLSLTMLISALIIQQYFDEYNHEYHSKVPVDHARFVNKLDSEMSKLIIDFCFYQQKLEETNSIKVFERCVKRLQKDSENYLEKTRIFLQTKARALDIKEQELAAKEKEIIRKWRKPQADNTEKAYKNKRQYDLRRNEPKLGEKNKRHEYLSAKNDKQSSGYCKKNTWNVNKNKSIDKKEKPKKVKNFQADMKKTFKLKQHFKVIKEKIKKFKKASKQHFKKQPNFHGDWYIKYNPVKETMEIINITTLPEENTLLIKNGNKSINGQWYFNLYGNSRINIRNREKASEWYFQRFKLRELKRNKAKWYFDYMTARNDARFFY
ncbi:hypothetical protein ABEB36_011404 [Hypothenemus hampei]|uniref:Uncharacterized protein n=1 Tax=Hypothenemus hampei TaxID=57062 RepID=A0ABD1EFA1_HYPHA